MNEAGQAPEDQRPMVLVNFAITANGRMANPDGSQLTISNEEDKAVVHRLRNQHDAILGGINTVLSDDPKLTVKEKYLSGQEPTHPTRIVLDSNGRTPRDALVLDGKAPTIIVTNNRCSATYERASALRCGDERVDIPSLLGTLHERGIQSLMVEGGPTVIQSFLELGLVNDMRVFVGGMSTAGDPAFPEAMAKTIANNMKISKISALGNGIVLQYILK